MKTNSISRKEIKAIQDKLQRTWPIKNLPSKIKVIFETKVDEKTAILTSEFFIAVQTIEWIIPHLKDAEALVNFPKVVVDAGAIRYICNGASVMRPGIKGLDDSFKKGEIVLVVEETHKKAIAVGEAVMSSDEAKAVSQGMIIHTLHYVGDKAWETAKAMEEFLKDARPNLEKL